MEINFKQIQAKANTDFKKQNKVCENPAEKILENTEAKVYPNAVTMRAYANIKPTKNTVSKTEVLEFLHEKMSKNDEMCEKYLEILTDSDGCIKSETFDLLKNTKNKFMVMSWIENSKTDGKINQKLLKMLEPTIPYFESGCNACHELPNYFKDKNGRFNNDLCELIKNILQENPNQIDRFMSLTQRVYMTSDKEFDQNAIDYHKEQSADKKLNAIFDDIYYGKDKNGKFSKERLEAYKEIAPYVEKWQIDETLVLLETARDKSECIELIKNLKTDEDLQKAAKIITDISQNEDNKTGLGFDKNSVEFIKQFKKDNYLNPNIKDILEKINIPYTEYTPEDMETINKLLNSVHEKEDIAKLIDTAIIKNGDKKGQFSFSKFEKYLEIYNNSGKSISEVNYISNILSLEKDDYALDTINKLYSLSWEKEARFGDVTEKLDRKALHMMFRLSTMTKEGDSPKREFHRPILDNLNKLMTMHLPMTSKGAFERFMLIPDFDIIEKLERVKLDEIGIDTGEMTNKAITSASEEDLVAFKNYMLDYIDGKDKKLIEVNLNTNIKDIVEIKYNTQSILYNMVKQKPVAQRDNLYDREIYFKDYEKNIDVKQIFTQKGERRSLYLQTVERHDNDGNLLYTEVMEQSGVNGVYNVSKTYPDGRVEDIVKAQKLENGNTLVEKNLTSPEGVKTKYRYEDDVTGNRIMSYKITDTDGKVLMNQSSTFEVLDENHFITSRNQKSYDIKFNPDSIQVKNIQSGETRTINIEEFTVGTQDSIIPLLKKIPGDELFQMKEINLKSLAAQENFDNAAYSPDNETIRIGEKYLDAGVLLHEFGHAKDEIAFKEISAKIVNEPSLRDTYEQEKTAAREFHSEAELDHLAYFGADYHYLGSDKLKEGIAESNMILDLLPEHEVNAIRSHYWMQDFPRVIAKLAPLLY